MGSYTALKFRINMSICDKSNILLSLSDKLNLQKRGRIEAVNDILMSVCDIDHTRHKNPLNVLVHILSRLTAYTFLDHWNTRFIPARINA